MTVGLRVEADWGEPIGLPSTWSLDVYLFATASGYGAGGAWAQASTTVRRLEYELFWPG